MNKLWEPEYTLAEQAEWEKLQRWYRGFFVARVLTLTLFVFTTIVAVMFQAYIVALFLVVVGASVEKLFRFILNDINLCAQDIIVYQGNPKFKH